MQYEEENKYTRILGEGEERFDNAVRYSVRTKGD